MSDNEIQFLTPEALEQEIAAEPVTISVAVSFPRSDQIGVLMDVIEKVAHAMGMSIDVTTPGYVRVFYGWERNVWKEG